MLLYRLYIANRRMKHMPDYEKMYALLCTAIDDVIEPLADIPNSKPYADALEAALLAAEEIYINTAADDQDK